jgi:hypothetical protein
MKRAASIEALLRKVNADFAGLRVAYDASLHQKTVSEDLKVAIKNIFENLRSCLDYLAQDIFDAHFMQQAPSTFTIPPFRSDGYLPEGVYVCSEAEVFFHFGSSNRRRRRLVLHLRRWLGLARQIGAQRLILIQPNRSPQAVPGRI